MEGRTAGVLNQLERTSEQYWNISPQIGALLNIMVKLIQARRVLEVGTSNGYSTIWLAEGVSSQNGKVVTIDLDGPRLQLARENLARAGLEQYVEFRLGNALDVIPKLEGRFDLVFLDTDKCEYYQYLRLSFDKLKVNGLVIAEDVTIYGSMMPDFLWEITHNNRLETVIIPYDDGISISRKKG